VDTAQRRIRGILIPWGEKSRTSASKTKPIVFPRGSVAPPRDPAVASLNLEHDRFSPIGRAARFEDQEAGLYAEFVIADTEEGDAWLADHCDYVKLSAEVRDIERDENDHGRAKLTGAALVTEGAFASAALFAIDATVDVEDEEELAVDAVEAATTTDGDIHVDVVIENPAGEQDEEEEEDAVAEATASEVMLANRAATGKKDELTFRGFAKALFAMHTAGDSAAMQRYMRFGESVGLFELADITYSGTGGLNENGQITGPQYLGELWEATPDVRTFIPAVGSQALTALTSTGWNVAVDPDAIATWAGNKTDIPTEPATVTPLTFTAQRFAGGNDIAREFFDFGHTEVIESWARKMVQLYMKKSDAYALAQVVSGAATATPGTVPSGADPGLTAIIDLAMQVYAAGGTPNVIRVAPNLYRSMLVSLDGNQFAYLGAQLGLQQGDVDGLDIRPDARLASSQLLVLDRNGVGVWELPGSPIRVDAVSVVNGGYDRAFFGYVAAGVVESPVVLKATLGA
jgi:hypothetical protein